jgi:hypothetical protein
MAKTVIPPSPLFLIPPYFWERDSCGESIAKNRADPRESKNRRIELELINSRENRTRLLMVERELSKCIEVTAEHILGRLLKR